MLKVTFDLIFWVIKIRRIDFKKVKWKNNKNCDLKLTWD